MLRTKRFELSACVLAAMAGCATIVKGTDQTVTVDTTPPGATCELKRDGQSIGVVNATCVKSQLQAPTNGGWKAVATRARPRALLLLLPWVRRDEMVIVNR